jgi:hypothetical protein
MMREIHLSKKEDHGKEEHPCSSWINRRYRDFPTTTRFTEQENRGSIFSIQNKTYH